MGARGLFTAAAIAVGLTSPIAQAEPVAIRSANFGTPGFGTGDGYTRNGAQAGGSATGWTGGGLPTGIWNPTQQAFANHADHGLVAYVGAGFNPDTPYTTLTRIGQTLADIEVKANTRYTLTLDVGNSFLHNWSGYWFALVAGDLAPGGTDLMLASLSSSSQDGSDPLGVANGTFKTLSLIFESGANPTGLGQPISILLGSLPMLNGGRIVYDNIRLDVSPIETPEPGAVALLGLGLAGLGFMRRRKA